ncbi:hypothetical protein [Desulfitobacterium chlororespirans]|uniref:Uncharacterized protein n=1 Tax=Desulfitobacterium chlororespirans DSM 11544 TaxID=1121395 RepID=A0A1M7UY23_9FIRM|nr:hypothetical protein [Desulfitobacterium chlororespirans]SHN87941.1 hypothetical protein SAMN02745215_05041 [Desulfitobacterium chlororespirans DSM 11544]
MNYDELKEDFTQAWYDELFRRLRKEGYSVKLVNDNDIYANIYWEEALVCQIDQNKDLSGDWSGKIVKKIAEETAEYVFTHRTSSPIKCSISGRRLRGFRKLLAFNDQVLAARSIHGSGYQFATGYRTILTMNYYILDKRFSDYVKACEDFALRAGLIDQDRIFSESEMLVIRSGLTQLISMTPSQVTFEELKAIGSVLNKISFCLVPKEKQFNSLNSNDHEFDQLEL